MPANKIAPSFQVIWRDRIRPMLGHFLLALMLAPGLLLPMTGLLGFSDRLGLAALSVLACVTCLSLCRLLRFRLALPICVVVALVVWFNGIGQLTGLRELLTGISLAASGVPLALTLIADKLLVTLALLVSILAFLLTLTGAGGVPALMLVLTCAAALWLADAAAFLPLMIPAAAAALTMLALARSEELRVSRVLPVMLALAAFTSLLIPASGVTIPPLKDAADQLRQHILDYFFFTEPRNVFTLATEGYYPMDPNQLGGPASPTAHPVMAVYTPRTVYLRASIRNEYTGRTWQDTTGGRRYLWVSPRWRSVRDGLTDALLPDATLRDSSLLVSESVTVRMMDGSQSSLFVPQRLRGLSVTGSMVPYFNNASEVFITRDQEAGDTYTVSAPLVVAGDPGLDMLLTACEQTASQAVYDQVRRDFTALPAHLQSQVFDLAQQAAAGAVTPYDKAMAIRNWLRQNYRYTLNAAEVPSDVDFVSHFLLVTKEGYCTYFASAMTVLCRMVGLPARYVEGYMAEPAADGIARVTGLNAHAWTEVYFAGYGWLTIDATPPVGSSAPPAGSESFPDVPPPQEPPPSEAENEPSPPPEEPEPDEQPMPSNEPDTAPSASPDSEPDPGQEPGGTTSAGGSLPLIWPWLLLLALFGAAIWRIRQTAPARLAARCRDEYARWLVWMQALLEALHAHGLDRLPAESMRAALVRADHSLPGLRLAEIGECTSEVFYGNAMPNPEDTAMLTQACAALTRQLTPVKRLQLTLVRAFIPTKKRQLLR